jgi:low temperature requirement protein LtrA
MREAAPISNRGVWQRPELRQDRGVHRSVGWLELFFDLIFVVIIAVLAASLADGNSLIRFAIQFLAVFWVWNGFTYYTERFESGGVDNRLFTFIGILAIAGLAIWGSGGLGSTYLGFAASYLLARGLNIFLWLRAGYWVPRFRAAALGFSGGFVVASALIVTGAFVSESLRLVLFSIAVVVEIFTPAITGRFQFGLPPLTKDKYPERFGLLTLIVLGETVAEVIRSVAASNTATGLSGVSMAEAAMGLGVGFGVWWVYFDYIARRPTREGLYLALSWIYLHVAMLLGIVVASVGISLALAVDAGQSVTPEVRAFLLLGLATALLAITVMELTLERREDEPTNARVSFVSKIAVVVGLVGLELFLPPVPLVAVLGILLVALAIPAAYGTVVWFRRPRGVV